MTNSIFVTAPNCIRCPEGTLFLRIIEILVYIFLGVVRGPVKMCKSAQTPYEFSTFASTADVENLWKTALRCGFSCVARPLAEFHIPFAATGGGNVEKYSVNAGNKWIIILDSY
jgi:hypothetical protein